jgi:hypothetical protein
MTTYNNTLAGLGVALIALVSLVFPLSLVKAADLGDSYDYFVPDSGDFGSSYDYFVPDSDFGSSYDYFVPDSNYGSGSSFGGGSGSSFGGFGGSSGGSSANQQYRTQYYPQYFPPQPAPKPVASNTTNNTCVNNSCNTSYTDNSIVDNSIKISESFNTVVKEEKKGKRHVEECPQYGYGYNGGYNDYGYGYNEYQYGNGYGYDQYNYGYNDCYQYQAGVYNPPVYNTTPYVTLSSVPYTGLELGPMGEVLYWAFLVLWCLGAAYLIVVKRVQNKLVSALNGFLFGTATTTYTTHTVTKAPVAAAKVEIVEEGIDPFIASQIKR